MNKTDIRALITQSYLGEALDAMLQLAAGTRHENEVQLLSARFHDLERQKRLGVQSAVEIDRTRNQITHALLELLDELPDGGTALKPATVPPASPVGSGTGTGHPTAPPLSGTGDGNRPAFQTGTGDGGASAKTPVWIGLASLALILAAVLFVPCPSSAQFFVFRLILALGAAGIGSILPGFFNLESAGVKAGGALGLFALVYLLNPAKLVGDDHCAPVSYALTVFVTGKNGQSIQSLRQQGYVVLDVNGERKKELIDDKGQAGFKNLRVGDTVRNLNVEFSEPYKAVRPDSVYTLDASGQIYLEVALQHLGRVYGTVQAGDQPLAGVIVSVDGLLDTSDVTGSYSISIPESLQRSDPEVKFFKEGYRLEIKKAYPQTNEPLNIVMQKLVGKKR